jgi:hypothetical protein
MSSMTSSPRSLDNAAGLEPLRAKSGWIIALGVVYIIAGIIALGSVVLATVATVFVVGIMMVIAGVAEVINAFQIKTWGRFLLWLLLGALYIVAGFITFESAPRRGDLDAFPRHRAHRLRHHAHRSRLQHAGRHAVDLGAVVGRHHAVARPRDRGALASVQPLHSGALPRHRSCAGGSELDWHRPRS